MAFLVISDNKFPNDASVGDWVYRSDSKVYIVVNPLLIFDRLFVLHLNMSFKEVVLRKKLKVR